MTGRVWLIGKDQEQFFINENLKDALFVVITYHWEQEEWFPVTPSDTQLLFTSVPSMQREATCSKNRHGVEWKA